MIFGRNLLEREQIPEFLCNWFESNSVVLYDYNDDTPTVDGWINFENSGWNPDRIEIHDGSTENASVLSVDLKVHRNI